MEDKLKDYIKDLILIRKCYIKKAKLNDQKGDLRTALYYKSKAIMLNAVIADLREIVKGEKR